LKSGAASLAYATPRETHEFLSELSENALHALPYMFEFWALDHQLPPEGDWRRRGCAARNSTRLGWMSWANGTKGKTPGTRVSELPEFDRVIVAVDPAVTSKSTSDACGIMVVGATFGPDRRDWRGYVLQDATVRGHSTLQWAQVAVEMAEKYGADRIVAEVNQGGDLVEELMRQVDAMVPYKALHASNGKGARAEPVAALYEQGRVLHYGDLSELEDEMCQMTATGFKSSGSPDRLDALVWAVTELMLGKGPVVSVPKVRTLLPR